MDEDARPHCAADFAAEPQGHEVPTGGVDAPSPPPCPACRGDRKRGNSPRAYFRDPPAGGQGGLSSIPQGVSARSTPEPADRRPAQVDCRTRNHFARRVLLPPSSKENVIRCASS